MLTAISQANLISIQRTYGRTLLSLGPVYKDLSSGLNLCPREEMLRLCFSTTAESQALAHLQAPLYVLIATLHE